MSSVSQAVAQILRKLTQVTANHFSADTRAIATAVFTGTGLNDLTAGGAYSAVLDHTYAIKITVAAGTDKFQISVDGGAYGTETSITGSAQTIANGMTITFGATTGHTLGDIWTIVCTAGKVITASGLQNIVQNAVGSSVAAYIYDGAGTTGTLLYHTTDASWAAGRNDQLGYNLSSGKAYVVLAVTTTAPDLIIGTN